MSRVRPNKKLKYIKINKKDYYYLIKKISFLTKNNKILTDENNNYKKINEELKNQLNNINRNTLKLESKKCYNDKCNEVGNWLVNNNLYCLNHFKVIEYHEQNNKIDKEVIEEDIYDEFLESNNNKNKNYEDEILESDLEDIEDELYEDKNLIPDALSRLYTDEDQPINVLEGGSCLDIVALGDVGSISNKKKSLKDSEKGSMAKSKKQFAQQSRPSIYKNNTSLLASSSTVPILLTDQSNDTCATISPQQTSNDD
jgi:hypothetical protein